MNISVLQREAHAIAKDHGWWDEERTFGDLIALVHSELSEALEAYREHGLKDWRSHTYDDGFVDEHPYGEKPEGVASELADVVIRVADMAEWYGVDLQWSLDLALGAATQDEPDGFGDWVTTLHQALSACWSWSNPPRVTLDTSQTVPLGALVYGVQRMAAHYGIDLDAAIEAKMEHNRTRSYRHGGKEL